ncbi:hypothetical protein ABIE89_007528 [Bradyrhizobium niftali]|uniref:hypothetical protein n=1 Tax=Bradyrhizobium niftali TaxID=2560055 RepID=UPI003836EDE6
MLEKLQNQLPVLEAVGGAQRMAAQYGADYANAMDQGKTATEAAALAAGNLRATQAQINSSASEQLASLKDQYAVASASDNTSAAMAQSQATYNSLLRQGVDQEKAGAIAKQQYANAAAQIAEQESKQAQAIYSANQKSVKASQDQLDLTMAQGTGQEAAVKSAIAYSNAIDAGATAAQAAAISTNVLYTETLRAAQAANQLADAEERAQRAARYQKYGSPDSFDFPGSKTGVTASPYYYQTTALLPKNTPDTDAGSIANGLLSRGADLNQVLGALEQLRGGQQISVTGMEIASGLMPGQSGIGNIKSSPDESDIISTVKSLFDLKNAQTNDKSVQAANLQQEMAWLESRPVSIETLKAIADLRSSIDQLTGSTNDLNSTNQDLLSPYYSQDPRTSHIGFRSQGMATGGELTVPGGYSANDNMLAQIPVASGEIVSVRRPGQSLGGNSSQSLTINLGGITVNSGGGPVDTNAIGRTVYQATQLAARQLQAAGR